MPCHFLVYPWSSNTQEVYFASSNSLVKHLSVTGRKDSDWWVRVCVHECGSRVLTVRAPHGF